MVEVDFLRTMSNAWGKPSIAQGPGELLGSSDKSLGSRGELLRSSNDSLRFPSKLGNNHENDIKYKNQQFSKNRV